MDDCTFGNSKAAINLMRILNNPGYQLYARRASRMLAKYLTSLKAIGDIPLKETRETVLKLWLVRFRELNGNANFPLIIETHMNTVATGQKRKLMKARRE